VNIDQTQNLALILVCFALVIYLLTRRK